MNQTLGQGTCQKPSDVSEMRLKKKIKWLLVKREVNFTHSTVWRMSIIAWIKAGFNFNLLSGFAFQIISTNNKWSPFTLIGWRVLDKRHFWHMLFVDEDGDSIPEGHKKQAHYPNQTYEAQRRQNVRAQVSDLKWGWTRRKTWALNYWTRAARDGGDLGWYSTVRRN